MKKAILTIVFAILCMSYYGISQDGSVTLEKQITDENGKPLSSATISVKSTAKQTTSNQEGHFILIKVSPTDTLQISFVGYLTRKLTVKQALRLKLVKLTPDAGELNLVEISTGYQTVPKERATGSFSVVDSTILSKRVTTNILDKLDGQVSGLIFNRNLNSQANNSAIAIRGRSTLFANPDPLIVLDNFSYDGNLENINPNDIETITILKDAAAASIWGVRAGNGVIVITTKKGKRNASQTVSVTSNLTIGAKPELYTTPWINSSDFIDLEQFLFNKGMYNNALNNKYLPVSAAVQVMVNKKNGLISLADSVGAIDRLKQKDIRQELEKYYYQKSIKQQYQLNVNGGTQKQKYFISGGYDKNRAVTVNDEFSRLTLNANNTYYLLKDKLEVFSGITFTNSKNKGASDQYLPYSPYDQLADENGKALEIGQFLKPSYTDTAGRDRLMDWKYRPLDEQVQNRVQDLTDYRINLKLGYQIINGLKLSLNYQYQKGMLNSTINRGADSFYTRNLINTYSSINTTTGVVTSPIANGAILNTFSNQYDSQNGRVQADFTRVIGDHEINIVVGAEVKAYHGFDSSLDLYGYDESTALNANSLINPNFQYTNYYTGNKTTINTSPFQSEKYDRYRSYYAIGSYVYKSRYTLSASFRKDESNLFGVKSNQKGVPLWSVGGRYDLSKESFYHVEWLPSLILRTTYGYNGNVDKSTSAYLTASPFSTNPWGYQYSQIINPPNPSLAWERIQNINFGLDFVSKGNFISGSIDYFVKRGKDLIANSPIVPQTGITVFKGNSADTKTTGLDLTANFNWLRKDFSWTTNLLFSYNKELVTSYKLAQASNFDIVSRNFNNPIVGYPYNSIFSLRYGGLDATGNPIGYLNGEQSQVYTNIIRSYNRDDIIFHGSATPVFFGNIRNIIGWKGIALAFNITYKLDYYVKQQSVFSGSAYVFQQVGYNERWQAPGDELKTNIPSLIYPANSNRAAIFSNSEVLINRGDHIRLQYMQLSAPINRIIRKQNWANGSVYFNMDNLGIIWKKEAIGFDPDYNYNRLPLTISLGLKLDLN